MVKIQKLSSSIKKSSGLNLNTPHAAQLLPYLDEKRFQVVIAGRRFGKDLDVNTKILCYKFSTGKTYWSTMGKLSVGEYVFNELGQPTKITFVSEIFHNPCYKLTFSTGESITAGEDHKWVVNGKIFTTKELFLSTERLSIVPARPLNLPEKDLLLNPYLMGYHIGDGTVGTNYFTIGDQDINTVTQNFLQIGITLQKKTSPYDYRILEHTSKEFGNYRKNKIKRKYIPKIYLDGSIEQRLALLQGLCDTDGSACKAVELSTTSNRLYKQYSYLLRSLGVQFGVSKVSARYRLPNGKVKRTGKNYRLGFNTSLPVFRISRKLEKQKLTDKNITIISIEPTETVPTRCISVDSPSHMYLCGETLIPTHNTELGKLCAYRTIIRDAGKAAWFSPTHSMYNHVFREMYEALQPLSKYTNIQEKLIILHNGGELQFWSAENSKAVRGRSYDFAILDEAAYYKSGDSWESDIRPTLADRRGRAYFLTTPNGRNYIYELFLAGQKPDNDEMRSWRFPSIISPFFDINEYNNARISMPARVFEQEYNAEFLINTGEVFKNINDVCILPYPSDDMVDSGDYVFGIDFARKNDFTVVVCLDVMTGNMIDMMVVNKLSYLEIIDEIEKFYNKWKPISILAEENSAGDPVIEVMRVQKGMPVQPFVTSNSSKARIIQNLALKFEKKKIFALRDPELIRQLQAFTIDVTPSGKTRYAGTKGYNDDIVIAFAIANEAIHELTGVFGTKIPVIT
jgi:hypothetical protein